MPYVRFHHLLSEVTFFSINPSNYITLTSLDTNNPPENSLSQRKVTRGHWSISITNRYDAIEIYVNYIVQKQMGCNISTHVSHVSAWVAALVAGYTADTSIINTVTNCFQ